mgnify:FL=1
MHKTRYKIANPPPKPLLVYDGDCHFCRRWITRWESLTGGHVAYAPFKEVHHQYPEIPTEAFENAVQLIMPTGEVMQGAEGVFEALAFGGGKRWPL